MPLQSVCIEHLQRTHLGTTGIVFNTCRGFIVLEANSTQKQGQIQGGGGGGGGGAPGPPGSEKCQKGPLNRETSLQVPMYMQ